MERRKTPIAYSVSNFGTNKSLVPTTSTHPLPTHPSPPPPPHHHHPEPPTPTQRPPNPCKSTTVGIAGRPPSPKTLKPAADHTHAETRCCLLGWIYVEGAMLRSVHKQSRPRTAWSKRALLWGPVVLTRYRQQVSAVVASKLAPVTAN